MMPYEIHETEDRANGERAGDIPIVKDALHRDSVNLPGIKGGMDFIMNDRQAFPCLVARYFCLNRLRGNQRVVRQCSCLDDGDSSIRDTRINT